MTYAACINISSWQMPFGTGGEYKVREEDAPKGHRLTLKEKPLSGVPFSP